MKTELIEFEDVYNISKRIKEINPNYSLYYNRKSLKFEVYTDNGERNPEIVWQENIVDDRLFLHLQMTRKCRFDEILKLTNL